MHVETRVTQAEWGDGFRRQSKIVGPPSLKIGSHPGLEFESDISSGRGEFASASQEIGNQKSSI